MARNDRHAWLAKRHEQALDPLRQIIDPHHHLWDRASPYLAPELLIDTTSSHNVTHTVFVECSASYDESAGPALAPVGETRFVAEQAREMTRLGGPTLAAIVGHVDLTLGSDVRPVLEAHDKAGDHLFRGVRHGTNWSPHADVKNGHHEPTAGLLADKAFRSGVSTLAEMGFSLDAWLYFDQITELADLALAVPDCTVVLNHLGGPLGIGPHASARDEMQAVWRKGIAQAATCPNIALKVGGIGMEHYFGTPWANGDAPPGSEEVALFWSDMVHVAIDAFGPSRCMFESNFPVDRQTLPYSVLWNAFQIMADRYDPAEQDDLFAGTAARSYRIGRAAAS